MKTTLARVPRPAGRHPVDRELDRVRRRGVGHALYRQGVHFVPVSAESHHHGGGLAASQQVLSLKVALFCFGWRLSELSTEKVRKWRNWRLSTIRKACHWRTVPQGLLTQFLV